MSGNFNHQTITGDTSILIMYNSDFNYIHIGLCKGKSAAAYRETYLKGLAILYKTSKCKELHHKIEVLDNVMSIDLKKLFDDLHIKAELVPPNNHRRNIAERMMRTTKNHIIAMFASCDPFFPPEALPYLIPQAEITLNLMRKSNIDPTKSAYEIVHGPFDFNKTPLAPPGCPIVVHDSPNTRASWAPHGTDAYYVGPAPFHYRCYTVYIPSTKRTRISDTIAWLTRTNTITKSTIQSHVPQPPSNFSPDYHIERVRTPASEFERVQRPTHKS